MFDNWLDQPKTSIDTCFVEHDHLHQTISINTIRTVSSFNIVILIRKPRIVINFGSNTGCVLNLKSLKFYKTLSY